MKRHERGEAQVIPILLRATDWEKAPFGKLGVLPTNNKPITDRYWATLDDAFREVVKGIEVAIKRINPPPIVPFTMDVPRPGRRGPAVLTMKSEYERESDLDEKFTLSYALEVPPYSFTLSSGDPSSLAISSDGLLLVCGSISQGTTKVWNLRTKQLVYTLKTSNYGQAVAISPDTHFLASSNQPGLPITSAREKIKVWDLQTGKLMHTFAEHEHVVTSQAFTPDSQALISGSFDAVKMWDLRTGLLLHTFQCSCLTSLAINSDGLILSSDCLDDQKIKIRNAQTGQVLYTLPGLPGSVLYTAISPDGRTFVSSSNSEAIKIWDMQTSKLLYILERGPDTLLSLAISSDRQTLVKAFKSKIEVWEKRDRRLTKRPGDDVDRKAITDRLARLLDVTKLENKSE